MHVITRKCKVLPVGAFIEGQLHLECNCFLAHSLPFSLSIISFVLFLLCFKEIVEGHCPGLMTKDDNVIHKHFTEMRRMACDETPFLLAMPPRATTLVW